MEKWQWTCLLLCIVGFCKEFRPSEPYVTKYLIEYKNFSKETVIHVGYPIATYTYLGALPVVFLLTDFLRYKPVLIFQGFAYVSCYALLIWTSGLTAFKILEVLYGIGMSADVAYYTYIYAKVDRIHYKKVTSFIHSACSVGNLVGAILAQSFVSSEILDIGQLNYFTFISMFLAFTLSTCLPSIPFSMYFFQRSREASAPVTMSDQDQNNNEDNTCCCKQLVRCCCNNAAATVMKRDLKSAYGKTNVMKWCFWWAIASAGYYQITNYVQALWEEISESETKYNAAVDAIHRLLAVGLTIGISHMKINWSKWGEKILAIFSIAQGLTLWLMAQETSLFRAYVQYIIYRILFQVTIFIASAEVAEKISEDSYALIFGINTFTAILIQTGLTFTVSDENGIYPLNERNQFMVYSGYHICLGGIFSIFILLTKYLAARQHNSDGLSLSAQVSSTNRSE